MKTKIICVLIITILLLPLVTAQKIDEIPYEYDIDKNQDDEEPRPHYGLSFVFYYGNATVYEYYEDDSIIITIRPFENRIRWFCIGRPFGGGSAGGTFAVCLDNLKGYVGPKPIVVNGSINFIFGLVERIIVCLS